MQTAAKRLERFSILRHTSQFGFRHTSLPMKVRSVSIASCTLLSSALPSTRFASAWTSSTFRRGLQPVTSFTSMFRLDMSTVVTIDESTSDSTVETTTIVSEGNIVARFPGGLTAIRLNDGDALGADSFKPSVFGAPMNNLESTKPSLGGSITSFDLQGRRVTFPDGTSGLVVAHRPPVVFVWREDEDDSSSEQTNGQVQVHSDLVTVSLTPSQTVMDAFGKSLAEPSTSNDAAATDDVMTRPVFSPIPQVKDIALINKPMLTGVTMIDSLAPIGKGQNMLMVGHDLAAMRGYVMDALQTQVRDGNAKIVYATTEDESETVERLRQRGLDKVVHVVAPSRRPKDDASRAAEAVAIAGSACSVAEMYALEKGMDALVVVDTIDLHKQLWDVTTRVLVDVFGIDSVVEADRTGGASSECRGFFSSLIQRSAQYKESRGGGSVTLLLLATIPNESTSEDTVFSEKDFENSPEKIKQRIKLLAGRNIPMTAANLRKVDIPVPSDGKRLLALQHVDDLISMSDGQIWLDERLEAQDQWPPMNPQRSVTRIGIGADTDSRADAPALRKVDGRFRLDLSQAFNMVGADQTEATRRQILRKDAVLLAMHQTPGSGGRRLAESCVLLLAATTGKLDNIVEGGVSAGSEEAEKVVQRLLDHVLQSAPDAMMSIDQTLDMSDEVKEQIMVALDSYSQ